ncbi:hypothetical protein ACF0H5_001900 [Mactra antiquata]
MAIGGNSPRKSQTFNVDTNVTQVMEEMDSDNEEQTGGDDLQLDVDEKTSGPYEHSVTMTFTDLCEKDISDAEEYIQKFLLETLGHSDSSVYDCITKHGKKVNFPKGHVILRQGNRGSFAYILLSGTVNVLSSDNDSLLTINEGSIVGEMSLLFNTYISANVQAFSDVSMVTIPKKIFLNLMNGANDQYDVIDWHIRRRYLPLGKHVDSKRVYRRLALSVFKTIPTFQSWTSSMLKDLILTMNDNIVTLYPEGSFVAMEEDPLTSIFIVIEGNVEIKKGERIVARIDVDKNQPFVFTESSLHFDHPFSSVNIRAVSGCQVIQIRSEDIKATIDESPTHLGEFLEVNRLYRVFRTRLDAYYKHFEADLQIEILVGHLKTSDFYVECSMLDLREKILKSDPEECFLGQRIYVNKSVDKFETIIVAKGEVVLMYKIMNDNGVAYGLDNEVETKQVAEDISDISETDGEVFMSNTMNEEWFNPSSMVEIVGDSTEDEKLVVFKTGSVIVLDKYEGLTFTAKTRGLLLKIGGSGTINCVEQNVVATKVTPYDGLELV